MRISEIMPGQHAEHRRVGILFPRRQDAMHHAVRLFRDFALDSTIEDTAKGCTAVYVECGPIIATHYLGMMERACGVPGFNEWDLP